MILRRGEFDIKNRHLVLKKAPLEGGVQLLTVRETWLRQHQANEWLELDGYLRERIVGMKEECGAEDE